MKIFSGDKTLSPSKARNCLFMNLFATPGLGSLMGGRILAGLGQLILFLIGFGIFCVWFYRVMKQYYSISDFAEPDDGPVHVFYFRYFLAWVLFAAAGWLWSLLTSLQIMRQAKLPPPAQPGSVPPRITN